MARQTRTPRDRATEVLTVELGKLDRIQKRIAKLEPELKAAREVETSLASRVEYLSNDPVLDRALLVDLLRDAGLDELAEDHAAHLEPELGSLLGGGVAVDHDDELDLTTAPDPGP